MPERLMLRSVGALRGYTVLAKDGEIGNVHDFYFHVDTWTIRYLVVDAGHWLPGRKVLVTTGVLRKPKWAGFNLPVQLTREQVQKSPEIDTDKPVSRQNEVALRNYYGWPFYWIEPGAEAWPPFVPLTPVQATTKPSASRAEEQADRHLRRAREIKGYHIHADDGALGHVEDLITDDAQWVIRYLVVHTERVLPAKKVLISPQWLQEFSYPERQIKVTLTRERILNCPQFYPGAEVSRQYEERINDYYGRPTYYWEDVVPAIRGRNKTSHSISG